MYVLTSQGLGQVQKTSTKQGNAVSTSQILRLFSATSNELALRERLDADAIFKTDQEAIRMWWDEHPVLEEYLKIAWEEMKRRWKSSSGPPLLESWSIKQWENALVETGALRRHLAIRIKQHYDAVIRQDRNRLSEERKMLKGALASQDRINDAIKRSKQGKKAIDVILGLKDAADKLESVLNSLVDPSRIPSEVLKELGGELDKSAEVIKKGVALIANYSVQLQIVIEGYSSVGELRRYITTMLENIMKTKNWLMYHHDRRARAQALEEIPYYVRQ
jgi:hypothetical protein